MEAAETEADHGKAEEEMEESVVESEPHRVFTSLVESASPLSDGVFQCLLRVIENLYEKEDGQKGREVHHQLL